MAPCPADIGIFYSRIITVFRMPEVREICGEVALVCTHGGVVGRKWGCWEDMDERGWWIKKVKDLDGDYVVDLVGTFFSKLDMSGLFDSQGERPGKEGVAVEAHSGFPLFFIGSEGRAFMKLVVPRGYQTFKGEGMGPFHSLRLHRRIDSKRNYGVSVPPQGEFRIRAKLRGRLLLRRLTED